MNTAIFISILGLMLVVGVHIAVIARWSGKIDGFISATEQRIDNAEREIVRLREARHRADGILQQHAGILKQFDRRFTDRQEEAAEG